MGKKPTGGKKTAGGKAGKAAAPASKKKAGGKKTRGKTASGRPSCFMILAGIFVVMIVLMISMAAVTVSVISKYTRELPELQKIVMPEVKKTTKVYAATGEVIAELYEENREYAVFSEIPDSIKLAFIATEDERFFKHQGIDLTGIGRAGFLFFKTAGTKRHGASTITQQLARNTYLAQSMKSESSLADKMTRKVKEMILAITLEKKYSKEEILENYLNLIYLGHGAHGIKTATRIFFGKKMGQVTIAEAAMLAAMPKGPSIYDPYRYPERVVKRRNAVLENMFRLHFITKQEFDNAAREKLNLAKLTGPGYENYKAPYFVTYILDQLQDANGPYPMTSTQIYRNGYKVYTTLDMNLQKQAEESIKYGFELSAKRGKEGCNMTQGALIALRPQTGAILAMVGGKDYKKSKFNRAWQAMRQPGSSFKPFVYITAIKQGYPMETMLNDGKLCYRADNYYLLEDYCPNNYDHKYKGPMNFHTALVQSRNVPAVKVGRLVGSDNIIETAHEMGISSPLYSSYSLPLGTSEITVMDMAVAYSTLANGGYRIKPIAIERITTDEGRTVYQHRYKTGVKVLGNNELARIVPVLQGVINEAGGTGGRARIDRPAAGKTGTTSDYRDAWFCGFVPQMTTIVWFGNDDNSPLRDLVKKKPVGAGITGGVLPAPVWGHFMKKALEKEQARDFVLPAPTPMKTRSFENIEATGTANIDFLDTETETLEAPEQKPMEPELFDFGGGTRNTENYKPDKKTKPKRDLELIEPEVIESQEDTDYNELF